MQCLVRSDRRLSDQRSGNRDSTEFDALNKYVLGNAFGGWFRSLSGAWVGWLKWPLGDAWFPVFQHLLFAGAAWAVLYWLYRRRIFFKV